MVRFVLPLSTVPSTGGGATRRLADGNALPCDPASGNASSGCQRVWFPANSAVIDIVGSNFGSDPSFADAGGGLAVTVGGVPCTPVPGAASIFVNDTLLRCVAAVSSVGAVDVSVSAGGQIAQLPPALEVVALCGAGFTQTTGACIMCCLYFGRP